MAGVRFYIVLDEVAADCTTVRLVGYGGLSSETNWADLYQTTPQRLDAELFYVLRKLYWGQGLASEMAKAVIQTAFTHRAVDRVWTSIRVSNAASQRVAEKAGLGSAHEVDQADEWLYLYALTCSGE